MKTRRQRTCKARSSCSSRNGYEVSTQGSDASSTMSASTTLGSKRRAPYDHSDSEASLESQKQQRLVVSPSQQQCEHPRPDLSRTDSVTLLEGSVASADSQLLCTEAFAAEDDTSSFPHDQAGEQICQDLLPLLCLESCTGILPQSPCNSHSLSCSDGGICVVSARPKSCPFPPSSVFEQVQVSTGQTLKQLLPGIAHSRSPCQSRTSQVSCRSSGQNLRTAHHPEASTGTQLGASALQSEMNY